MSRSVSMLVSGLHSDSPQGVEDPRIIEIPTTSQRQFCLPSTSAHQS